MDTLQTVSSPEEHKLVITDVRFRPNSNQLATASVDKSVRIWDAANVIFCFPCYFCYSMLSDLVVNFLAYTFFFFWSMHENSFYSTVINKLTSLLQPSYCVQASNGHSSPVMSLDFHPRKTELFCFCDDDNEIHYWNLNLFSCMRMSKVSYSLFYSFMLSYGALYFIC